MWVASPGEGEKMTKPYIVIDKGIEIFLVEIDLAAFTGRIIVRQYVVNDETRREAQADFKRMTAEHNMSPALADTLASFANPPKDKP